MASGRTANSWLPQGTSGPFTGSVQWGGITGNSATLYALSTNNGIQAFTVTVIEPPPAPEFSTIRLDAAAGTFTLGWNSTPGTTWRVEASNNLVDWSAVATGLPADAGGTNTFVWTITAPYSDRAHLRVVRE